MRPEDRSNYDYLADGIGVSMNVIDFIEVWWLSLQVVLEPTGVAVGSSASVLAFN
jgi:hypothetical protein